MTAQTQQASEQEYRWEPQPRAQALVNELIEDFLNRSPRARTLSERMRGQTSTKFHDWLDFIEAPETPALRARLEETGFANRPAPGAPNRWIHEGAIFPQVLLGDAHRVGVNVDRVSDFFAAQGVSDRTPIYGEPMSQLRTGVAFDDAGAQLLAVERRGGVGFEHAPANSARSVAAMRILETLRRRDRDLVDDAKGFARAGELVDQAISVLTEGERDGHRAIDSVCDLFFEAERDFWQRRNAAARWQKARQDALGLGWANHDHHTFRCSRANFTRVIALFEKLGFHCRERFYAGEEAGWGAQVLEQPRTGIVIFADVDLSPEEIAGDFAHTPLPPREGFGTVGLWCALHGESALQAGMHHLECQFDHAHLTQSLEAAGHKVMDPFTTFDFLRQAFTQGEMWEVSEERIERLEAAGAISEQEGERFRQRGAVGSHLENLERNDGYKGFNQEGVSDIIARTDARSADYEAIA